MIRRLSVLLLACAASAQSVVVSGLRPDFVDFSASLRRPGVSLVLGTLGKMRDGKRHRLEDPDAHIGAGKVVARISGTQYYRVDVRAAFDVQATLAGPDLDKLRRIRFEVQLARLPDGRTERQLRAEGHVELRNGLRGLWVLEKTKRGPELRQVVPRRDDGGDERAARAADDELRDLADLNLRMAALRTALERADQLAGRHPDKALAVLRSVLEHELELRDPRRERLVQQYVEPWERRARARLEEIEAHHHVP